jgi:hypothetical protein
VVRAYELLPGTSWSDVTPSVLRYLDATGEAYTTAAGGAQFEGIWFRCGVQHPVVQAIPSRLPLTHKPYAWYLRVADLAGFMRHVIPALEARLMASDAAGQSEVLSLDFYGDGVKITLDSGRIAAIERWERSDWRQAGASFPGLIVLQLLFGYRSLDALEAAYPDCRARTDAARFLLTALFPPAPSRIWEWS